MIKITDKTEKAISPSGGATALVNDLIEKAVELKASDMHLEPAEHNLKVRYRVDGLLQNGITIHKSMVPSLIARVKVMVSLDIGESRLPQDGKTHLNILDKDIDLRVSTIPTIFGEKVVLRLLDRGNLSISIEQLGMGSEDLAVFTKAISKPQGLILVTGPTGSGKTTTLYCALNKINSQEKNIITIEDPVEYQLQGINQIQVNYKTGLTFAKGLRSILRQDPDVIMVGEIRDSETAKIAIQAAMTGHLVFSTMHTNSSVAAVERLIDMGAEPYLVATSLTGVISQRLLRLSCPKCKECGFKGYRGRTGIYEIFCIDDEVREMIIKRADRKQIEKTAKIRSLLDVGLEKVNKGLTSKEELFRVVCEE